MDSKNSPPPTVSPEHRLLLDVIRVDWKDRLGEPRLRAAMEDGLEWTKLQRAAIRQGILPLVHRRLAEAYPDLPSGAHILWVSSLAQSRVNTSLIEELSSLVTLLEEEGIDFVVFKGPVLASIAYRDLHLRPYSDLDLLVRVDDALGVRDLLVSRGYLPDRLRSSSEDLLHLKRDAEWTLLSPGRRSPIDLHWRFAPAAESPRLEPEEILRRRVFVLIAGKRTPAPEPEDQLLHLCLHSSKHLWESLGAVCDLAALIRSRMDWDWSSILDRASRAGLRKRVLLGLSLARELAGVDLSQAVATAARREGDLEELVQEYAALLRSGGWDPAHLGEWERLRRLLRLRDTAAQRCRHVLRVVLLPTAFDLETVPLRPGWYPLHYLLRPVRLIREAFHRSPRSSRRAETASSSPASPSIRPPR